MTPATRKVRELGQFFTPRPVVDFALDALAVFGARIDDATLIDPACGPGEWLAGGLQAGAATACGVDCDPEMIGAWQAAGLTSNADCMLSVADSLDPHLAASGRFDLVVGNPPFGARLADRSEGDLREIASHYRLFGKQSDSNSLREPTAADLERLRRFPTELLFLERFVELARDGGWIAIILPAGVMANSRWKHARSWLLDALTIHAAIALPRATFRAHSTTASTCLLLMHKRPASPDHRVALAGVEDCSAESLQKLLRACEDGSIVANAPPEGLLPPPLFRR